MAKSSHARYVDRRLSVARQTLDNLPNEYATGMDAILNEAALDNAYLQAYFALHHYVNELLEAYGQAPLPFQQWHLTDEFFQQYHTVSELREIKVLAKQANSWVNHLLDCPNAIFQQALGEHSAPVAETTQNIIAISSGDDIPKNLFGASRAKEVIQEFSIFVQRQREHLVEY